MVRLSPHSCLQRKIDGRLREFKKSRSQAQRSGPKGPERLGQEEIDYLLDLSAVLRSVSDEPDAEDTPTNSVRLTEFVAVSSDNRGQLMDRYDAKFHPGQSVVRVVPGNEFDCSDCGSACIYDGNSSYRLCPDCGSCEFVNGQTGDNITYDQQMHMNRSGGFSYIRKNHLNELLAQIQGQEPTEIPEDVLDSVKVELHKMRVYECGDVTTTHVDDILHRLGLHKWYEHVVAITALISGRETVTMPPEIEDAIRTMFNQAQAPWEKHKPPGRTNFLNYSYVLYQLCRLLEADEFLPRFRLLKSRQRLAEQDSCWRLICAELRWAFYPVC